MKFTLFGTDYIWHYLDSLNRVLDGFLFGVGLLGTYLLILLVGNLFKGKK